MVTTANLVSYYKFDENAANTTVADSHGSNTGTSSTNTSNLFNASGKINSAFDFTAASSEKITVSNDASLQLTDGSISLWVNPDLDDGYVIDKGINSTQGYAIIFRNDETMDFLLRTTTEIKRIENISVPLGEWTHLGMSWNNSTKEFKAYKNAVQVGGTTSFSGESPTTGTAVLGFGFPVGFAIQFWDGKIDEAAIFNTDIGLSGFQDLYNSGAGLAYPFSVATTRLIKISGTFVEKPILTKVAGTFVDKPIKIKVGGTFQDA